MDAGVHKAFAVDIDPSTGNMSVAWVEPPWSQNYITLIGPSYGRVFVNANMSSPVAHNVSEMKLGPIGANYMNRYIGETPRRASYLLHLTSSPRLLPTQTCLLVMVGSYRLCRNHHNNDKIC